MAFGRRPRGDASQEAREISYDAPTARGIELDDEEDNLYSEGVDAGHRVDPRAQKIFIAAIVLIVIYFVGLICPKDLFNVALHYSGYNAGYTLSWFLQDLSDNVNGLLGVLTGNDTRAVSYLSTMIRYVVIALAGAGLALCGAVYQGSFKNALVSPSTLGVMSGSTLGMMIWVVFFVSDTGEEVEWLTSGAQDTTNMAAYLWSSYSLAIISFLGCICVVGFVLLVMRIGGRGKMNATLMIITGQVIGSIMGAVSNTIRYYYISENAYGVKAQLLTSLQISSFYRVFTPVDIFAIGIPLGITFVVIMRLRRRMMLLSFSKEEAHSMGVDSRKMQIAIVSLCTLLTALIISFCGSVGFVGFLVPHLSRRLVGPNFSYLLPMTTVVGGVFVLGAYVLLQITLGPAYETMVGMFISIGGAAVFLVTALSGKGGARGQF